MGAGAQEVPLYTATVGTLSSVLSEAAVPVADLSTGVCGLTFPTRCSLLWMQLHAHGWQEAHAELQQGRKRQMLMRHRNQPGDQQHQQSRMPPAAVPSVTYKTNRDKGGTPPAGVNRKAQVIKETAGKQRQKVNLLHTS